MFNDSSTSEKQSEVKGSFQEVSRLKELFCYKIVFNMSKKILSEAEIKVLEKGFDFTPIQKTLNEPKDFEECSRRKRCKWNFRNRPTNHFSEIPAFILKSGWKHPKGHASLELFLSRVEQELLSDEMNDSTQSNLS